MDDALPELGNDLTFDEIIDYLETRIEEIDKKINELGEVK